MIASQMGDTRYRGKIIWMLLTSRPDLLPIDLKRQGRCEVHIPLFSPHDAAEIREMFEAMAKKNKIAAGRGRDSRSLAGARPERRGPGEHPARPPSGQALLAGREQSSAADLEDRGRGIHSVGRRAGKRNAGDWPPCSNAPSGSFLPPEWREKVAHAGRPRALARADGRDPPTADRA